VTFAGTDRPVLGLVESNTTGTGRAFAAAARRRGLRPVLLSSRPERYPWVAEDAVAVALVDSTDAAAVADTALAVAASGGAPLAGLVTSSEYFVAVTARAAARLGLPGADPGAVERCRDKRRQRAALAAAAVLLPASSPATTPDDGADAARTIGFPVVVKPADGTGSRGVLLCGDAAAVRRHTAGLLAQRLDERGRPTIPAVLVEEYVSGPEVSVETFGTTVIGVTAKHLGPHPRFVEYGHDFPAGPDAAGAAGQAAVAAIDVLGLGFGAAHTEIRLAARGPVLIEVNPRLAGGHIPTLVRLATGIDLVGATVEAAVVGPDIALPEPGPGHASIRFLVAAHEGRVRHTGGVEAAAAVPDVVDVTIAARVGHRVGGTGSFLDRVGHVIAAAPTGPAARAAAETAVSLLQLDVDADVATAVAG
jgi:biotin carboxylase